MAGGGGKSWDFAASLLLLGKSRPIRILCCREQKNSIAESIHALFKQWIIGDETLINFFEVKETYIRGANGTEILFSGLQNAMSLKSFEAADYVWIEEASTLKKATWDILEPTIRKEGSEIWLSFNPVLSTDFVYKYFVLYPPADAIVVKLNYMDNPFCPSTLIASANRLQEQDVDEYNHIYLGHCQQTLSGAVYAKELRAATTENRITRVPYTPGIAVDTFWDLGWSDRTAIWFIQRIGLDIRIINYYECQFEGIDHYVKTLHQLDYFYGYDYLPHDANHKNISNGGKSVVEQLKMARRKIKLIPNRNTVNEGIFAVRRMFAACVFDEVNCADGITHLRSYCYRVDANGQFSKEPKHDEHSHAADAFRYVALGIPTNPALNQSLSGRDYISRIQNKNRPTKAIGSGEVYF
ncbi:MAG: PBSX family phage terminase large subunit [Amoebophilaceae bacterium]|nr:PBSX family phage terminase large subunit [Amoebophilaceae bacterium]